MDHKVKMKEGENIDKYLDLARELKEEVETSDDDIDRVWCTWNSSQRLRKENEGIGNQMENRDSSHQSIVMVG